MKDKKKTNSIWKKVLVFLLISAILLPSIPVPNGIMASSYQPEDVNAFSDGTTEGDDGTDESAEQGSSDGIDAEESDNEESDVDENPTDVTNPDVEFSDGSPAEETDTTPTQDTNEETEGDDFQGENETDFTDGENSETNPPEEDDLETEEETSGPESLVYEDGSIRLTASCCEEGAIPQGTVLQVEAIEKEKSSTALTYQGAEEKLSEKAQAQWYELQGFLAYDIAFVDEQGNKQQPNGSVRLTLEYKPNAVPSTVSQPETCIISAAELSQDDFGQVTQVTELTSGEITTLETTANGEVQKLEFVKNRLAAFAIVWNSEVSGEPDEEEEITPTPIPDEEITPTPSPDEEEEITPTPSPDEEEEITPTPTPDEEEEITPTPTPDGEEEITPTPMPDGEEEITPTPTPDGEEEITPTPTPDVDEELTPTPTPDVDEELTPTPTPELEGLVYEDGNVKAVLNAAGWEIPEGASLRVTSLANEDETAFWMNEQITSKLTEESEDGENHISGFLAYEIAIEDELGNEIEPEGQTFVSIQYKEGVLPEALREAEMTNREISLWQLETNEEGLPVQMVNMKDNGTLTNLSTTESQGILEAEFSAQQLTSYAAVWTDTQEPEQEEPEVSEYLEYEDDSVKVVVSAVEEGSIPEGSTLKVVPVLPEDEQTAEKYTETEAKLQEKAESEEFQVIGFLAYDITFVDEEGNKVEPSGQVQVSMEYKEAAVPEAVKGEAAETAEVTVLHLEEDENGEVTQVVDMGKSNQLTNVETTETKEVEKAEFVTDSFSVFTITWKQSHQMPDKAEIVIHYVDTDGKDLDIKNLPKNDEIIESITSNRVIYLDAYRKFTVNAEDGFAYDYSKTAIKELNNVKEVSQIKRKSNTSFQQLQYYGGGRWQDFDPSKKDSQKGIYTYNIYFIYTVKGETPQPGDITNILGEPEHNKCIKKNSSEDYTISLDVTGKQGNNIPIDILLIIDQSESMKMQGRAAYKWVNNALGKLKEGLVPSAKETEVEIAVVTFSGPDGNSVSGGVSRYGLMGDALFAMSWTGLENFSWQMTADDCYGVTNWQAGIRTGAEVLGERNKLSKKYVIFLTDGAPTISYKDGTTGAIRGNGNNDMDGKNYEAALKEWIGCFAGQIAGSYIVDANNEDKTFNKCKDLAEQASAKYLDGKSDNALKNSFTQIAQDITKPCYTNVYIKDTLSEFVYFKDTDTPENSIKVYQKDSLGFEQLMEPENYKLTIDGKTITVTLLNNNQIQDGTIYRVEVDVVPTLEAYYEYSKENKYPHVGEENTDYPNIAEGEKISSGKPGFHSNEKAVVGYKENDGEIKEAEYKHPVIQVEVEYTEHTVEKKWVGETEESVEVTLIATAEVNGETVRLTNVNYKSLPEQMTVTLNGKSEWAHTWKSLPQYYYFKADDSVKRAEITYTVDELEVPKDYEKKVELSKDNPTKTIITNTKKGTGIAVKKIWTDEAADGSNHKSDTIYVGLYEIAEDGSQTPVHDIKPLELKFVEDTETRWIGSFDGIDNEKQYVVQELVEFTNGEFTIDNKRYTGVVEDGIYTSSDGKDYKVSYCENQEEGFVITNHRLNTITLKKLDKSSSTALANAKFKLEKQGESGGWNLVEAPNGDNGGYQIETDDNGIAKFENLEDGIYRITEIQSPAGYSLLLNPIEVTLPYVKNDDEGNGDIQTDKGVVKEDGTYYHDVTYTIYNNKLFDMPEGGGTGTQGIVFAGIFMMLAAGGYGLTLRKRKRQTIRR